MPERSEETVKLGLLMEAAATHQALATGALERLREHTAGIDAVVREEIRHTLLEELHALSDDCHHARDALLEVGRAARRRFAWLSAVTLMLAAAVPAAVLAWWLPSPAEIAALREGRAQLSANLARLAEQGGRVQLRRCGSEQRLCVRIDHAAPAYGEGGEFRIVQGY
jgi:hypothetical protein